MSDAVYNKLAFTGWIITFYNHESRVIETNTWDSPDAIMKRNGNCETFPSLKDWIEGFYNVYGDVVGRATDLQGNELYNNMDEMNEIYDSVGNWP